MRSSSWRSRGFTLIEAMIAVTLLGLGGYQGYMLIQTSTQYSGREVSAVALQQDAQLVLDRIAYAILSADRENLEPEKDSPLHSSSLNYRTALGIENGNMIWGPSVSIGLEAGTQAVWRENPHSKEERKLVWSKAVRELLQGETLNGIDDNGNGFVDEKGMSFSIEGNKVTAMVCLERRTRDGRIVTETLSTTVCCRNLGGSR